MNNYYPLFAYSNIETDKFSCYKFHTFIYKLEHELGINLRQYDEYLKLIDELWIIYAKQNCDLDTILKYDMVDVLINFYKERLNNPKIYNEWWKLKSLINDYQSVIYISFDTDKLYNEAILYGSSKIIKWLDENFKINYNENTIKNACINGNIQYIKFLHDKGIRYVNSLNLAIENNNMSPEWLYENNYEIIIEKDKLSPVDLACQNGHVEIIEWVYKTFGKDVFTQFTIDYAAKNGNIKLLNFLYKNDFKLTILGLENSKINLETFKWIGKHFPDLLILYLNNY